MVGRRMGMIRPKPSTVWESCQDFFPLHYLEYTYDQVPIAVVHWYIHSEP